MTTAKPGERALARKAAALTSWGNTVNRTARTEPARTAFEEKFLAEAGGDPVRAESLRKAHYAKMAYKSARARRRRGYVD
jgi:hypothetical protein